MPSGIICTVRLDPFYQRFLRFQFQEFDPVFSFPKGHDLSLRFQFYLGKSVSCETAIQKELKFKIEVPYMEHKNPFYYNTMSAAFQKRFQTRIMEFWRDVSHELMGKWIRDGYLKEDVIQKIIEEFGFTQDDDDRIRREYRRYRETERKRRFRNKNKMLKNVKI